MTLNNKKGFTLIELLIATAIVSALAAVAVPQFSLYKIRAYNVDAQTNLRNVFQACKGFWTFNGNNNPCLLTTVSNNEYGFIQSADVEIMIESNANNNEYDFYATASHILSSTVFAIDYRGVISKSNAGGVGGNNGGNNEGDDGGNNDEDDGDDGGNNDEDDGDHDGDDH
jgi:type IV pilus assembly protein PilA